MNPIEARDLLLKASRDVLIAQKEETWGVDKLVYKLLPFYAQEIDRALTAFPSAIQGEAARHEWLIEYDYLLKVTQELNQSLFN